MRAEGEGEKNQRRGEKIVAEKKKGESDGEIMISSKYINNQ